MHRSNRFAKLEVTRRQAPRDLCATPLRGGRVLVAVTSLLLALVAHAAPARADEVSSYAIVVGSNAGGPGQDELRFAERDARRVAAVLRELGGYPEDHVTTVLAPTPADLLAAIDGLAATLAEDQAAGRRTLVFFYYSGHARASALVLGKEEVALADLRDRITRLPATVTIVVLDACQSGAFTRVKGAEPVADFSFNSRTGLDAAGLAVLASSSESELSQESDFLEGSYFTHHLLVGLRGGGDRDRDGRVSLDEAYQYAYDQTLVATSHTAVGSQHVSFEADLKGQGEVPLTYPEKADATLTLPASVAGDVLVQRLPAEAVLAEVHKVEGASFDVAIPAGRYRVLIRTAAAIRRCPATVAPGATAEVDLAGCDEIPLIDTVAKHGEAGPPPIANPWTVEVAVGLAGARDDDFTRTLEDFDYQRDFMSLRGMLSVEVGRRVLPHLAVFGRVARIDSETWRAETESEAMEFSVTSHALSAGGHAELASRNDRAVLWAEAGLGITWSRDRFENEMDEVDHENFFGAHLVGAAGLTLYSPWVDGLGFDVDARWLYAPTVDNRADDTMDVGGLFFGLGVVYRP
jgi:hypothetical protein